MTSRPVAPAITSHPIPTVKTSNPVPTRSPLPASPGLSRPAGDPGTRLNGDRLSVIVVDDHELSRKGLVTLLEQRGIRVAAEAGLAADGIRQALELTPDVVVMDLCMPGMSGIEATQRLTATAPRVRVLVLTAVPDVQQVMAALHAGACGYLLKDASIDHIIDGIRAAARGESSISPSIASCLIRRLRQPDATDSGLSCAELTPREIAVLELLARGMDNRHIAEALHLSQHTVKPYVASILAKLQVENRIQAVVRAVRCGLV